MVTLEIEREAPIPILQVCTEHIWQIAVMDAWRLDEDVGEPVKTVPKSTRRVFFADGDDDALVAGKHSVRKKTASRELVIDDDEHDEPTGSKKRIAELQTKQSTEKKRSRSRGGKVDETADADTVQQVSHAKVTFSVASAKASKENADVDVDLLVHHLVRSHLILRGHDDVAALLEIEKPCPAPSEEQLKDFCSQVSADGHSISSDSKSVLEQFVCSEKKHAFATNKVSSHRGSKDSTKSKTSSRRKKPVLNVITSTSSVDPVDGRTTGADELGYNRLNHPGSTPRSSADPASVLGDPGSTPMARAKDLAALGFDDVDAEPLALAQQNTPTVDADSEETGPTLSQYALAKRAANKHKKRVRLGDAGATPTKEYIFFRETPPRFVTETVEAAVEIFTALGNDPEFRAQAAVVEKFVELQSSDVGKYRVGQRVESLGAQRNVTGVVAKVFGSRECGSSGPGTIVIDTSPNDASSTNTPSEQ